MVFTKFSRVGGHAPIFKKFVRPEFLLDSLEISFKLKLHMSSFQENQVWGCGELSGTRKTPTNFFQAIISDIGIQLPGAREFIHAACWVVALFSKFDKLII